ncbi:MAG: response regulator [Paracoccaceae bacterium]
MNFEDILDVGTILVVEDDAPAAKKMIATLDVLGHGDVLLASDLKEADRMVAHHKIDLALLNVKLAKGGRTNELGRRLAASGARVVFLSEFKCMDIAYATLGFEFIEKPISLSRLKATLHRAVIRDPLRQENASHI